MHLAHDAERHVLAQSNDVGDAVLDGRPVIEHEQQAGERERQEEKEAEPAHAPCVAKLHAGLAIRTGCRCRNIFDSITSTRVAIGVRTVVAEDSLRAPACVSVSQFQNEARSLPAANGLGLVAIIRVSQECSRRINPLPELVLERAGSCRPGSVHRRPGRHANPLERTGAPDLEIDRPWSGAAAVARALDLDFVRRESSA